jgi:hypothetical protein
MRMRIVFCIGQKSTHIIFWERVCLYFLPILRLCVELSLKVKSNLEDEISRQHSTEVVRRVLLTAFGQIYNENQELKIEQVFKNLQFGQKNRTFKVGAKESEATEEIKASTLHQDSRKDALRAF